MTIPRRPTASQAALALYALVFLWPTPTAVAQTLPENPALDSLIRANAKPVVFSEGMIGGEGGRFVLEGAAAAEFFGLGEEHNARPIPQLFTAFFRQLQPHGYEYVALEQDPVSVRAAATPPMRGSIDSIASYARRYPYAFTFDSDDELTMIAEIGRLAKGRHTPVWGLDQAFGASHILDRLLPRIGTVAATGAGQALLKSARQAESRRDLERQHYMARVDKSQLLAELAGRVAHNDSENRFLIDALLISDSIYRHYREERYHDNSAVRELYMKRRFAEEVRQAVMEDGRPPKVILKFGHWHLYRGLSPAYVQTLGNFVSEYAIVHNSRAFIVGLLPNNPPGSAYGDLTRWRDTVPSLLARAIPTTGLTVVDTEPLRRHYRTYARFVPVSMRDSLRRWVFGFDAILFIGGMEPAPYRLTRR